MKNIYLLIFLIITLSCKSFDFNNQNYTKSQNIYVENIKLIDGYVLHEKVIENGIDLENAALFLEKLTGIKSDVDDFEFMIDPSEKNLKKWKKWFKRNKEKLCFDEKEQKVKVRND
ncbi:MAG: hypothetical protein L3J23_07375 [Flavobacteriaceae bacterium]|nr:hypothetical protein [Flavobacteriaceae bacterium]